jgi:homopolymeric O-antigen transport system permease protein
MALLRQISARRGSARTALLARFRWRTVLGFSIHDLRLLVNLTKMALRDRFLGSTFGRVWAILNPLLLMTIFSLVFSFVFKSRLPGADSSLSFILWLISGYGPWLAVSEGISAGTSSITGNTGLVKNLSFKSELLPMAASLLGLIPLGVAFGLLVVLLAFDNRYPGAAWLLIPLVLALQFMLVTGIALFLSAVNVFVRDMALILPNLLVVVLFASPIFYPVDAFPPALQTWVRLNPFYLIADCYRQPLIYGQFPDSRELGLLGAVALGAFVAGLSYFRRLKGYFDAML